MVTDPRYLTEMLHLGLLEHIAHEIEIEEYDVLAQALSCVATLFLNCTTTELPIVAQKLLHKISPLIAICSDMELLVELLQGLIRVATCLLEQRHVLTDARLLEVTSSLTMHPLREVQERAVHLEGILTNLTQVDGT
jgi:hypothetical protein